jgi:hypothetical protein
MLNVDELDIMSHEEGIQFGSQPRQAPLRLQKDAHGNKKPLKHTWDANPVHRTQDGDYPGMDI